MAAGRAEAGGTPAKVTASTFALTLGGVLLSAAAFWAYDDYRKWLRLGSGGLPGNLRGWLQTSIWRLQKRDPLDVRPLEEMVRGGQPDTVLLSLLPPRASGRPRVGPHPVPHRQLDQRSPPHLIEQLRSVFDRVVAEHAGVVGYALSHFERHTMAVTLSGTPGEDPIAGTSHGEIGHVHEVDGSMHMILSPSDAIAAIEGGWAEKHGLAGRVLGLPATYMLVYAPQNEEDVAAAARMLEAAIAYMSCRRQPYGGPRRRPDTFPSTGGPRLKAGA